MTRPVVCLSGGLLLCVVLAPMATGQAPYGLESRSPVGPYLNNVMPADVGAATFPPVLSATGAFTNLQTLAPADGLIPFTVNSPLWSDGAVKTRWMAVPNDGPPYAPNEQIGFAPVGEWSFPNGTVFVKHFELTVNEATGERKRQETRFLVRNSAGGVYGITYKWRPDNSDADLLSDGLEENVTITGIDGATRVQRYTYPSRADCLFCHNQQANYVLGPKTHQLNGEFTYPATGQVDNQLRTLNHLGLLNPPQNEASFATYLRSVSVASTTAPVQTRMRSWIDANCSHCHRPGGFGPGYDGRFYTPLRQQNLINKYVKFRDLAGSLLYQRDNSLNQFKMPPVAKNVIHETAMETLRQWIASPFEVLSVYLHHDANHLAVRFNSRVDPVTATQAANYSLSGGASITGVSTASRPDTIILAVSELVPHQRYTLTVNRILDTALSANMVWPGSRFPFAADFSPEPTSSRLANISTRVQVSRGERVLIAGFIARGDPTERVMLRGLGPSLAGSGIASVIANPKLELYDSAGSLMAENDDWEQNTNRQEIADTGIPPSSPEESVILCKLPSGKAASYTAILRSSSATSGIGLLEVYDLEDAATSELVNISSRGFVQSGEKSLISGFVVAGPTRERVIIRAIGPSLPVDGKLRNPVLELVDGNGTSLGKNDDWRVTQEAAITATGVAPPDDLESAIVTTLGTGAYTAVVQSADSGGGVALVEIYTLK